MFWMRFLTLTVLALFLVGCEQMGLAEKRPLPTFYRGVAGGVGMGQRSLDSLKKHGIVVTDSREGAIVFLQADKVFIESVDRVLINPEFQGALNDLAHVLKGYPAIDMQIVGHTDDVMNRSLQARQSSRYAEVVAEYLKSAGVSGNRMTSVRGESARQPVFDDNNFDARRLNRRVEIILAQPLR